MKRTAALILLVLLLGPGLPAQESPETPTEPPAAEAESSSPDDDAGRAAAEGASADESAAEAEPADAPGEVPIKDLKARLVPLTAEELATRAEEWQARVKEAATEVAEAKVREGSSGETVNRLTIEQTELLDRLDVVVDAWESKGGDAGTIRSYATAVRGAQIDVKDPSSTIAAAKRWLASKDGALSWVWKAALFIVILIVAGILSKVFANVVSKALRRRKRPSALLVRFAETVTRRVVFFVGVIVALSTLGVNVGAMVALIGGGAFIIGFALQDSLGNFANGVMLMLYRPFEVGDAVEVGGVSGSVDSVSLVNTTIRSWDNKVIIVPNKNVWGQTITNITGADVRRVDMVFGIGYGDDADKAQEILERVVKEHELVLEDPEPNIRMNELADSSVNFICRPWTKTADYWTVYWDVMRRVKREFDANGVTIPFPQRDVHIHQLADGDKPAAS